MHLDVDPQGRETHTYSPEECYPKLSIRAMHDPSRLEGRIYAYYDRFYMLPSRTFVKVTPGEIVPAAIQIDDYHGLQELANNLAREGFRPHGEKSQEDIIKEQAETIKTLRRSLNYMLRPHDNQR